MTVGEFIGVERGLAPSLEASNLKVMLTTDGSIFGLNHEKGMGLPRDVPAS